LSDEPRAPSSPPARKAWKSFFGNLTLVVLLCVSALFTGIAVNGEKAIESELHARAESLFRAIVLARKWNAVHGGVLVEKTPGMASSPFLPEPDVGGSDGKTYTRKNPALMAREISELASADELFQFHITSLRPINPANAPDPFEERALAAFARGDPEATAREARGGSTYFRYMAPLYVEASCLRCHAAQGYALGEVRGGISIAFNVDRVEQTVARNRWITVGLFLVTALALTAVLWRLVAVLSRRLEAAEARIRELAITDDLTGLWNRRHVGERLAAELVRAHRYGETVSCVVFDVDRFKSINDTHGHDAGDAVLRALSAAARAECRSPDVLGRWGGEEFLLVLPRTGAAGALAIAARLREVIEGLRIEHAGRALAATASFGVATVLPGSEAGVTDVLKRADEALYRAKALGRNRVELAEWAAAGEAAQPSSSG
jgi:diguanylate cyclase (GGDEF)-like protein